METERTATDGMKDRIWLTWERQRRNQTLSAALHAELYELDYRLPRLRRWLKAITTSIGILLRERPRVLIAQNPSMILALMAVWYGRVTGRQVLIDAHNAGVYPFLERTGWKARLLRPLLQATVHHIMRLADITIVSNQALAEYVDGVGGRGFVLPDPLPRFDRGAEVQPRNERPTVLFICTWAPDEPYLEVLKAAALLPPEVRVQITGNSKGREQALERPLPDNVDLLGFVPEDEFVDLLHRADVVMDLTTLENCLVCGAYEAVAAGRPAVLSATDALEQYFYKGAVFARNDAESIAAAVRDALARQDELTAEVGELAHELSDSWERRRESLETLLRQWSGQAVPAETTGDR